MCLHGCRASSAYIGKVTVTTDVRPEYEHGPSHSMDPPEHGAWTVMVMTSVHAQHASEEVANLRRSCRANGCEAEHTGGGQAKTSVMCLVPCKAKS